MNTLRVSAAYIVSHDDVLIAHRVDGEHEGFWEFPGGKVEKNESGEEAIIREIREELGITISPERLMATVNYWIPGTRRLEIEFYQCRIDRGSLDSKAHPEAVWVDRQDLKSYRFLMPDRLFLHTL